MAGQPALILLSHKRKGCRLSKINLLTIKTQMDSSATSCAYKTLVPEHYIKTVTKLII